jgi:hypothetical protein
MRHTLATAVADHDLHMTHASSSTCLHIDLAKVAVNSRSVSKPPCGLRQKDRANCGRPLRDHFYHFDPSGAASLQFSNGRTRASPLGYVTARIFESTFIAIGIVSLLAFLTLRQDLGGAGSAGSLVPVGRSLVAPAGLRAGAR